MLKDSADNLIITGDFNSVMSCELDIISGNPHSEKEMKMFKKSVEELDLTDTWRNFHCDEKAFTWSRQNPFIARRLDYAFTSDSLLNHIVSCDISSVANTDHRAVILEINDEKFVRGPGYWRFNNSYLKDPIFIQNMNEELDSLNTDISETSGHIADHWEKCKSKIKDYSIEYGKFMSVQKRNELVRLQRELQKLEEHCAIDPKNVETLKQINKVKHKLELASLERARGAQVRSRIRWIEEGEKNTRYFLGLEKTKGNQNVMTQLKVHDEVITNQADIIKEQVNYYSSLYSKRTNTCTNLKGAINNFVLNEHVPKLKTEDAMTCEGRISEEEAGFALSRMKNGTSPGRDGLTIEFYKFFWGKIKRILTKSFNESYDMGELSHTQREGVIILLHKGKDMERDSLGNWRPITLLNTDYKIMAKVMSLRLSSVIGDLISEDQVGYLRGRNISSIIRTIDDVIEYYRTTKQTGFLLALDYQKAFDSISKDFMLETFEIFGFGERFRKWVRILLNSGNFSRINHGGWLSDSFDLHCGIRQGCPFSPLAFILAVELLAIKIRNSDLTGVLLPPQINQQNKIKIKQLADDMTLFLHNSEDMDLAKTIIDDFSRLSGLQLNSLKTKALKLGLDSCNENLPFQVVDKIKMLGVFFKTDTSAVNLKENWETRVDRMENIIHSWSKRDLGINGKVIIIKTFLTSQLVYIMQSIGLPEHVLLKINRLLYKFLWQRKFSNKKAFEKIKRKVVECNVDIGGINMFNINRAQESFHLQWAQKLMKESESKWTILPKWFLKMVASDLGAFDINCSPKEAIGINEIKSDFWKNVIITYLKFKNSQQLTNMHSSFLRKQPLWNNTRIRYKGKVLFFKRWKKAGLERIGDIIVNNEDRIMSMEELIHSMDSNPANTTFEYNALINAIPTAWTQLIESGHANQNCMIDAIDGSDISLLPKISTRYLLNKELENYPIQPCVVAFWQRKLNFTITKNTWLIAYECTQETRLRELQWKILHHIYPTNILLHKMKEANNNKCPLCLDQIDFMEHFFFSCPIVNKFWESVEKLIQSKLSHSVHLTALNVLFGVCKTGLSNLEYKIINHIILIGKMCISIYKKTNGKVPLSILFEQNVWYRKVVYDR